MFTLAATNYSFEIVAICLNTPLVKLCVEPCVSVQLDAEKALRQLGRKSKALKF